MGPLRQNSCRPDMMIKVVPAHEAGRPGAGLVEVSKALGGKLGANVQVGCAAAQ